MSLFQLMSKFAGGNFNLALADGGNLPVISSPGGLGAKAYTPNTEQSFGPVTPGTGAAFLLAVADVTPTESGLLVVDYVVTANASAPDTITVLAWLILNLTAVVGGVSGGTNITKIPTSTAPAAGVSPATPMLVSGAPTAGAQNTVSIAGGGTLLVPAGQRVGVALIGASTSNAINWTSVGYTFSVLEQAG